MTSTPAFASDDGGGAGRPLSVRVLVWALIAQIALGAAVVLLAVNGFPFLGGPAKQEGKSSVATPAATPIPNVDRFDAPAAFAEAGYEVGLGPRPAGSETSRQLAEHLRGLLPSGRFEEVPGGLRNVVGHLPGSQPAVVIGAHYDTKEIPGFVGANDGASGTASVVELSRALARHRRAGGSELRFVLFDGEESPASAPQTLKGFLQYGLRGSKAYVAAHRNEVKRLILLDFVGDRSLSLPREEGSNRRLWEDLRAAARRVGVGRAFPDRTRSRIYDDHTPFTDAGIPAIDLIDFSYPYFHTTQDTLDKISAASLDVVGEAVTELARRY